MVNSKVVEVVVTINILDEKSHEAFEDHTAKGINQSF